nr:MAG TPA: hypothetical protein [Caudoviricetes sp.]
MRAPVVRHANVSAFPAPRRHTKESYIISMAVYVTSGNKV